MSEPNTAAPAPPPPHPVREWQRRHGLHLDQLYTLIRDKLPSGAEMPALNSIRNVIGGRACVNETVLLAMSRATREEVTLEELVEYQMQWRIWQRAQETLADDPRPAEAE